jgi:branched-chain amino acid transport system permease protein
VVVLTVLNEVVLRSLGFDELRPMLYGSTLIAAVLFLPKGLESLVPKVAGMLRRRPLP